MKSLLFLIPFICLLLLSCGLRYSEKNNYQEMADNGEIEYPFPFSPVSEIEFEVTDSAKVTLEVYAITGQKVLTTVDEILSPGKHKVELDASTYDSGIYFYKQTSVKIPAGDTIVVFKKIALLK